MLLKNSFTVPRPPEETWGLLLDVPSIVGCVPGAELTAAEENKTYKGFVAVRLGPVALKFAGTATITDIDEAGRTATIRAKGSDQQGRGNAGAVSKMQVAPDGEGSIVTIDTDLQLSGMVAQYGRASGVIIAVSNEIVTAFARCLKARLESAATAPSAPSADTPPAKDRPAPVTANPLGVGLFFRALVAWLRGLFGDRKGGA